MALEYIYFREKILEAIVFMDSGQSLPRLLRPFVCGK